MITFEDIFNGALKSAGFAGVKNDANGEYVLETRISSKVNAIRKISGELYREIQNYKKTGLLGLNMKNDLFFRPGIALQIKEKLEFWLAVFIASNSNNASILKDLASEKTIHEILRIASKSDDFKKFNCIDAIKEILFHSRVYIPKFEIFFDKLRELSISSANQAQTIKLIIKNSNDSGKIKTLSKLIRFSFDNFDEDEVSLGLIYQEIKDESIKKEIYKSSKDILLATALDNKSNFVSGDFVRDLAKNDTSLYLFNKEKFRSIYGFEANIRELIKFLNSKQSASNKIKVIDELFYAMKISSVIVSIEGELNLLLAIESKAKYHSKELFKFVFERHGFSFLLENFNLNNLEASDFDAIFTYKYQLDAKQLLSADIKQLRSWALNYLRTDEILQNSNWSTWDKPDLISFFSNPHINFREMPVAFYSKKTSKLAINVNSKIYRSLPDKIRSDKEISYLAYISSNGVYPDFDELNLADAQAIFHTALCEYNVNGFTRFEGLNREFISIFERIDSAVSWSIRYEMKEFNPSNVKEKANRSILFALQYLKKISIVEAIKLIKKVDSNNKCKLDFLSLFLAPYEYESEFFDTKEWIDHIENNLLKDLGI
jgi:hypothetical protein